MNALTLSISDTLIHKDAQGRYCLNDLHKASGDNPKHKPANFLRLDSTKELFEEINRCSDMRNAVEVKQGGNQQGTYVAKELVYAYAMWISPRFHLQVIRTFDALATQSRLVVDKRTGELTAIDLDYLALQTKYIALLEQQNSTLQAPPSPAPIKFGERRYWTPEEWDAAQEMQAKGLGYTRIGLQLGRTNNSVEKYFRRMKAQQGRNGNANLGYLAQKQGGAA